MDSEKSVLDTIPQKILGYTLTAKQQIWVYFLVATGFKSAIYAFDLASGIAVVNEHYKAGYNDWGTITLLLMYFPSLVFFIIIISRPDLWDEQDGIPGTAKWFGYRIAQFLAYPIWVMYRYAKQLFWSVEALLNETEREEALLIASQPSQTELYLFLQPFLQSIPQAFLQLFIMLAHYQQDKHISQMQVLCVTASLILVADTTVSFLWFESQKIMGRKEPWSPKVTVILKSSQPSKEEIDPNEPRTKAEDAALSTPFLQPRRFPTSESDHLTNNTTYDEDKSSDKQPADTENSTPLPDYATVQKPNTNPQEITVAKQTDLAPLPQDPAPSRPDSTNIGLPTRKIRKQLNGLEEEDALGKGVAFLWWFFFLFSRILSLAACANFQPYAMLGVLAHYLIIMIHLLRQTGFPSIYKVFIQLCLGYVFTFCFIEFRYKVKNVTVFYTCYFSLMLTEIIVMSLSWYLSSEDMDGFWYTFTFTVIFGSYAISVLSMASYFSILKPEVKVVYVEECSSPGNYKFY